MTGRLKSMDEENEIESDWKFAAMVIDRFVNTNNIGYEQYLLVNINDMVKLPRPALINFAIHRSQSAFKHLLAVLYNHYSIIAGSA